MSENLRLIYQIMGQDGEVSNDQGGEVNPAAAGGVTFVSVEFEVYGHVQGIYLYS